ncbi:hypothetical protein WJX81_002144 [Elliptochloris bilobata]|uniref:Thioesterase domain-containing protein n=1 Tax=Elliptochloris bilobata TaxID=381761 RepID=A0AAW1S7K8_9CHLO
MELKLTVAGLPLAWSATFSSVSALAGFSGHADYCAANAVADALASSAAERGITALSVQWGAWSSVGMAAQKHPGSADQAAALGMLPPADGMAALAALLAAANTGTAAGMRGAAAPAYWRLLLRGAPGRTPAMFAAERLGVQLAALLEDPEGATVRCLAREAHALLKDCAGAGGGVSGSSAGASAPAARSAWIAPAPSIVRMRLFCLPYAGGVSENVFARWAALVPACIQVCPVEIPGRGRRECEPALTDAAKLARVLAHSLPLQDKPYALMGVCLGAIVAYELARAVEAESLAPAPLALFVAAASPPDLYARAVMKLYLTRELLAGDPAPTEEVLAKLRGWRDLPRETVMLVFEKGNFAGLDAMRRSERLFNRVAPMGVADIAMAVQYRHVPRPPLCGVRLTAFDGLADATIERGNMARWRAFTDGPCRTVPVAGDHYFVTTHYREDKPYALFGACLGAIVAYELARVVEADALAPPPVALFVAAVSPPHLYAGAVTRLYLPPGAPPAGGAAAAAEGVLAKLRGWESLPRETVMLVFEKGNFAGLDEMKRNERLFARVAPMGVADIIMAVQYRHVPRPPLCGMPVLALEGLADATIDPAAMAQWAGYTSGRFRVVPLMGDHYFVSSRFREVVDIVSEELLDIQSAQAGGILGEHSWV